MRKLSLGLVLSLCIIFAVSAFAAEWEVVDNPSEAFQKGYLQVTGVSESGQSRYRAVRAATVIAQRDLLEIIQGISLHGETTISEGMLTSDVINNKVKGLLRGAVKCGEQYDSMDGHAEVCLRVYLRGKNGIFNTIVPLLKETKLTPPEASTFTPKPEAPVPTEVLESYDGLIVDVREFVFKPALINRILTEKGEVIFDPSKIIATVLVERGCGGFTNDPSKAKALLSTWGSKSPLSVKAQGVVKSTDVKVDSEDASRIYSVNLKANFLPEAKVVFVLK